MKLKGIVFDLDATLCNLGGFVDWRKAFRMAKEAYKKSGLPSDMINSLSATGLFNMLNYVRNENLLNKKIEEVERIQEDAYKAIEVCEWEGVFYCHLLPGCQSILRWLDEQNIVMGVATSNSQEVAERILLSNEIRRYFTSVVGRRPDLKMKPYPDQILKCFEEMDIDPRFGVVVGDSVKDVQAANSADIISIAIPSFFTKREAIEKSGASHIIKNLVDLPELLTSLGYVNP